MAVYLFGCCWEPVVSPGTDFFVLGQHEVTFYARRVAHRPENPRGQRKVSEWLERIALYSKG